MLLLTSTSDIIEVVTGSAVTIDVHASWVDKDASDFITPGSTNTSITTATTTTVVPAPAADIQRNVQTLNVHNKHATLSCLVTVRLVKGTTSTMKLANLAAGETLTYVDGDGWEITASALTAIAGLAPVGSIIMWSGTIAALAALSPIWAFCDGTANTPGPDLRDKFIVGATADDAGIAKTNLRGSLEQSAAVTGHSHSGHAALTHAGMTIGDHTGLTHGVTIANHPDLTHPALSHAAMTITHADHSVASFSGSDASRADLSIPSHTHASGADVSMPSLTFNSRTGITLGNTVTRSRVTTGGLLLTDHSSIQASNQTAPSGSIASRADLSRPSITGASAANASMPSLSHTHAAITLTHADHSFPSLSHQDIGTHVGTDYGVHTVTPPAAHGVAGTLTHSFAQPDNHTISAHDTVSHVPSFFALAFIQRMQ